MMMRRYEIGSQPSLDNLTLVESEIRQPGRGELLVKMSATSLNFHDYLVVTGRLPALAGRVPMSDGVGTVIAVGEGVSGFSIDDRVMGTFFADWIDGEVTEHKSARMRGDQMDGFGAEYVTLPETSFTKVPDGLTDFEAATLPCAGLTAWRALYVEGNIKAGQTVLVQGSGGVSIFGLQFAKMAGATVIATTSSREKAARLKALGADHVISYTEEPEWGRVAKELSSGGVDHLIEVVGGDITQSLIAQKVGGSIYMVGAISRAPITFASYLAITRNGRIVSLTVGSRAAQRDMVRAIENTGLKPVVDSIHPFEQLSAAFRHQEAHGHFGKICVSI